MFSGLSGEGLVKNLLFLVFAFFQISRGVICVLGPSGWVFFDVFYLTLQDICLRSFHFRLGSKMEAEDDDNDDDIDEQVKSDFLQQLHLYAFEGFLMSYCF